jgi:hypothetical protein
MDAPSPDAIPQHGKLGPGCPPRQAWEDDPEQMRIAWGRDYARLEWLSWRADHGDIPELTETLAGGEKLDLAPAVKAPATGTGYGMPILLPFWRALP